MLNIEHKSSLHVRGKNPLLTTMHCLTTRKYKTRLEERNLLLRSNERLKAVDFYPEYAANQVLLWKGNEFEAYKFPGSTGAVDNQVSHITNEVSLQAQNEKQVKNDKCHFFIIHRMQIPIASGCECDNWPVNGSHITHPQTFFTIVFHG